MNHKNAEKKPDEESGDNNNPTKWDENDDVFSKKKKPYPIVKSEEDDFFKKPLFNKKVLPKERIEEIEDHAHDEPVIKPVIGKGPKEIEGTEKPIKSFKTDDHLDND